MPMLPGRRKRRADNRPIPAHPYRDSALVYGGMGVVLVIVATLDRRAGAAGGRRRRDLLRARDGMELVGIPQADPRPRRGRGGRGSREGDASRCRQERERERRAATGTARGAGVTDELDAATRWTRGSRRSVAISPRCGRRAGAQLNALSWQTEAPLRMLLNNLDPEVAEHPEELVVYGGSGRAARSHEALRDIVRTLLRLRDDETLLVQSGKPVGRLPDARGRAARVDRELAARAEVGDLGRVPPARGRGADDVRPDDGGVVDLHRHPGHPPGHLPDLLRCRRGALRLGRSRRAGRC